MNDRDLRTTITHLWPALFRRPTRTRQSTFFTRFIQIVWVTRRVQKPLQDSEAEWGNGRSGSERFFWAQMRCYQRKWTIDVDDSVLFEKISMSQISIYHPSQAQYIKLGAEAILCMSTRWSRQRPSCRPSHSWRNRKIWLYPGDRRWGWTAIDTPV